MFSPLEMGVLAFLGFWLIFIKLPKKLALRLIGYGIWLDLMGTILVYVGHAGTYSVMVLAAISGICLSLATSSARWAFGYIKGGYYYPGKLYRFTPKELS